MDIGAWRLKIEDGVRGLVEKTLTWTWSERADRWPGETWARKAARLMHLLVHAALNKRLAVHASALTLTTVLSILPLVAVVLVGVKAGGWLDESTLQALVQERFPEFAPLTERVFSYLKGTDFRSLGIAGMVFLAGAVLSMFAKIERALNEIWGVRSSRNWARQALDYAVILLLSAVLILASWGLEILSADFMGRYVPWLSPALTGSLAYKAVSFLFLASGLSLLFKLLPNTPVPFWSAFIGGAAGAGAYTLVSAAYFGLQVGMANYNLFYSSLAALPITVIWIDISWILVLFCAELSYLLPNFRAFSREALAEVVSAGWLEETALALALILARREQDGRKPACAPGELAAVLHRPLPFVIQVLERLADHGLLRRESGAYRLDPVLLKTLRLQEVLAAVRQLKTAAPGRSGARELGLAAAYLSEIDACLKNDARNVTLEEALAKLDAQTEAAQEKTQTITIS